jgi:hypothetical protein
MTPFFPRDHRGHEMPNDILCAPDVYVHELRELAVVLLPYGRQPVHDPAIVDQQIRRASCSRIFAPKCATLLSSATSTPKIMRRLVRHSQFEDRIAAASAAHHGMPAANKFLGSARPSPRVTP